jgi:tetratricopeptide (TPR) repeat protein
LYEESLALYRQLGDAAREAIVSVNLAVLHFDQKDYATARTYFEQVLMNFRETGNRFAVVIVLFNLGATLYNLGEDAQAERLLIESIQERQEIKDWAGMSEPLEYLAYIAERNGEPKRAIHLLAASAALREEYKQAASTMSTENSRQTKEQLRICHPQDFDLLWQEATTWKLGTVILYASRQEV